MAAREHIAQRTPARDLLEAWIRQQPSTDSFDALIERITRELTLLVRAVGGAFGYAINVAGAI